MRYKLFHATTNPGSAAGTQFVRHLCGVDLPPARPPPHAPPRRPLHPDLLRKPSSPASDLRPPTCDLRPRFRAGRPRPSLVELTSHACPSTEVAPSSDWRQNSQDLTGFTLTLAVITHSAFRRIRDRKCSMHSCRSNAESHLPLPHGTVSSARVNAGRLGAREQHPGPHRLRGGVRLRRHRADRTASPPQLCCSPGHDRGHFCQAGLTPLCDPPWRGFLPPCSTGIGLHPTHPATRAARSGPELPRGPSCPPPRPASRLLSRRPQV